MKIQLCKFVLQAPVYLQGEGRNFEEAPPNRLLFSSRVSLFPSRAPLKKPQPKKSTGAYTAGLLVPFHTIVYYEEVCVAADLPSLTLSRESHDFTTYLTSWQLISDAFSKVKVQKTSELQGSFPSKISIQIASSIQRKRLQVAFDYIFFSPTATCRYHQLCRLTVSLFQDDRQQNRNNKTYNKSKN